MARTGGKRSKAQLTYNYNTYTPHGLKDLDERELRKEYSRVRSIVRKRIERMEKNPDYFDSQTVKNFRAYYAKTSEYTEAQLRVKLSGLADMFMSDRGSISGQNKIRDKVLKTLHDNGYTGITKENYKEFTEFMKDTRDINQAFAGSSEQVAEFFESLTQKQQGNKRYLREAMQNWSRSRQTMDKIQNTRRRDSASIRRAVE